MFRCLTFFTLVLNVNFSTAQQYLFSKQWDKRFGGTAGDAFGTFRVTEDSGFILMGGSYSGISGNKTQSNLGASDIWAVKLDSQGNKVWDKRLGGNGNDFSYTVALADKSFVIGASSGTNMNGDKSEPSRGSFDFWLIKIDSAGNKLWDKTYGSSLSDGVSALLKTTDAGFLVGGVSESDSGYEKSENNRDSTHFTGDFWIVKTDSVGDKLWDKTLGGSSHESIYSMLETADGGYVLGGISASNISGDKSENSFGNFHSDYWVVKIDSYGNKIWDKTYGTTNDDILEEIIPLPAGRFLLAGTANEGISGNKSIMKGHYGCWLVFIDSVGNILDEWGYDGGNINSIVTTNDGGYLIGADAGVGPVPLTDKTESNLGNTQSWLLKIDSTGQKQWDKTIFTTGTEGDTYALQTSDGCYVVANGSYSGSGGYKTQFNWDATNNTTDYWILKFCMDTVTGITELTDQPQISVSPNPFATDISISIQKENLHQATFTITNFIGQAIYHGEETNLANSYTKMLDLSYLPNGMYLLEVIIDGQRTVKQIIKQ